MTSPTWRDLAAGAEARVPAPPSTGVPAPTPNWRDLADQPPPAAPPAPAPAPAPDPAAAPVVGDGGWEAGAAAGASPLTPQATAPSSAPPGDPADAAAAVGARIAAAGAAATDVDIEAMFRSIKSLEAQVAQLTAERVQAQAPEVVKYATAFADHLQAKADAHPVINADLDHTFIPALRHAAKLVNAAEQVAATGAGHAELVSLAKDAEGWVRAHARRFPAIDYDYILQLAEEVGSAAVKLLA
jgi:hypothetical protein